MSLSGESETGAKIITSEEELDERQSSEYARSLIEASLDPLVTISPEGKITDVNEATIKVTGVGREKEALEAADVQLKDKVSQLERFNKLMIDRELKMKELKKEIKRLKGNSV